MILRYSHVGLCVRDLERSLRFYRDGLGFREVSRLEIAGAPTAELLELPDVRLEARFLERDGLRLELLRYATPAPTAGGVLAIGGAPLDVLDDAARAFDTVDAFMLGDIRFMAWTPLEIPRAYAGAVELADGTLLVSGGSEVFVSTIEDRAELSAERYVPATGTWYPEAPPPGPSGHPAVVLDDGSVLFGAGTRFYPAAWQ